LTIDTGCLVAMTMNVDFDVKFAGDTKSGLFGGEGLFLGTLSGQGDIWLQSLPFSRMADRIYKAAGSNKCETKNAANAGIGELTGIANLFGRD